MKDDVKSARLTAYVLGELDQAERAELEKELHASPSMSEEVETIRQTASLLREELAKEPRLYLSQQQRSEIEKAIGLQDSARLSRGWFLAAGGLAAAACLVMAVVLTSGIWQKSDVLIQQRRQLSRNEAKENSALKPKLPDIAPSSQTAADQLRLRRPGEGRGTDNRIRVSRGREQDKSSNASTTTFGRKEKTDEVLAKASAKQAGDTPALEPQKQVAAASPQPPKPLPAEEANAALKFAPAVGTLTSARLKSEAPQSRAAGVSGGARSDHAGEAEGKSVPPPAQSSLDQAVQENLISGAVTNTSDQPLSGAKIRIVDLKTELSALATSDDKGRFQIIGLPAGSFHVDVVLAGFKKFSQDVVLHQGEKLQINVKLLPVEEK